MAFADIIGHVRIKSILGRALQRGRLPNSLLFAGPPGVGKKETALVVAKALNCLNKTDDACEECSVCRSVNRGAAPDVIVIAPEGRFLKIEQMRLLKEAAYLKPMVARKRVFIIETADKMNREASNSLLKVLEEPPVFSHILLLTDNPFMLLPTIRSRCQILGFSSISRGDIEAALLAEGMDTEQARISALSAGGNLKQALTLDWESVQQRRRDAWELFGILTDGKSAAGFLKDFSGRPRGQVTADLEPALETLASFIRDLLLLQDGGDARFLLNPDFEPQLRDRAGRMHRQIAQNFLSRIDDCLLALKKNVNVKVMISALALQIMDGNHV